MLNATLVRRMDFGDDLCILRIRPDAGVPAFEPGQFIKLGLLARDEDGKPIEEVVKRAYSIASAPSDGDALELYLVKVREGQLTPEVWDLGEGDRLFVESKAQGEFTLEGVPKDHDLLAVATGTGVAPYVSMLRAYAGKQRWRRLTVVHGARRQVDLGYREELEGYTRRYSEVRYVPILSREPDGSEWKGLRGRVLQLLEPAAYAEVTGVSLDAAHTEVFLCGNPEMVQTARKTLEPRGFTLHTRRRPGTIHMERYW